MDAMFEQFIADNDQQTSLETLLKHQQSRHFFLCKT